MATEETLYPNLSVSKLRAYFKQSDYLNDFYEVEEEKSHSFIFSGGEKLQCYESTSIVPQQKNVEKMKRLLKNLDEWFNHPIKIFIDYAFRYKDGKHKEEVVELLKDWGFIPVVLEDSAKPKEMIFDNLEYLMEQVDYGLVLLSPDDELREPGKYEARRNVWIELGMLLVQLKHRKKEGKKRLSIINFSTDEKKLDIPSDILGYQYLTFDERTFEQDLLKELSHLYPKFD